MIQVRQYKGSDVDMLITASTVMESAIAHKAFLQSKRSTWNGTYFEDIKIEIDTIIETYLGIDNAKELRNATSQVVAIQKPALIDLAEVKVQIETDFNDNPAQKKEILNTLGFTTFYAKTQKNDQESLIQLLYQFKTNLTPELKTAIVEKGTAEEQLDKITSYADVLKSKNILQESKKGSRKESTQEKITAFNNIYNKVIAIAKISAKFFKDNKAVQEQFSFTSIKKKLNNTKPKPDATT